MKILYHHRIRSKDGQFVHLQELVHAFESLGHEVSLVGPQILESAAFGAAGGFTDTLRKRLPSFVSELLETIYSLVALPRLLNQIRQKNPDFIYERFNLFFPIGAMVAKLKRIPYVVEINGPLFEERRDTMGISLKSLARWSQGYVWRSADLALPVTEVLAGYLERYGVDRRKLLVLHNGVEFNKFANADGDSIRKKYGLDGKTVLGFTGFIRDWHRVDTVISAMGEGVLPSDTHLLLVGDGPELSSLVELAKRLNLEERVHFVGLVKRDEIQHYIAAFDIALQPAVTDYASPLKLIEYLAAGVAIVGPDTPNIRELLSHETNSLLFRPLDDASRVSCIARLSKDRSLRETLGKNAQQTISSLQLTWLQNARRIIDKVEGMRK
jgi:glycosyltransferase involved in cell wall biosynthesis